MGPAVAEVVVISFFQQSAQISAGWPVWLAVAGVMIMALLLMAIPWLRRPQAADLLARTLMKGSTLHSRLLVGFRLVAIVPVLTLLPLLAVISTATMQSHVVPQVEGLATSIATSVPPLIQGRINGIDSLAGHIAAAGHSDKRALSEALLRHHASSPEFASLWVARSTGDVVTATALRDGVAEPWAGPAAGVAMMDTFKRAVIAGKLYVSSVEKGAGADAAPMVFVSAPITLDGDPHWGFVQGLLNLRTAIGGLVSQEAGDSVSAVITDQRDRVILTSPGIGLQPLSDLSGHPLMTAAASAAPGKAYGFSGLLSNDGDAARYVAVSRPLANGWHVYATATQARADFTLLIYMSLGLIWSLLAVMLARGLAPLYGQAITQPLRELDDSLDRFDAERTISIIPPPPDEAPQEIRQTFVRVRESMRSSRDAYRNMIKAVNEGAELRKVLNESAGGARAASTRPATGQRPSGPPELAVAHEPPMPDATWVGRLDPVTELSGLDVFEGFFGEAWALGVTDSRPISVILVRISATDDQTLKLIARKLKFAVGRTLDLVARIGAWEFGMILPDTDLNGALAIAGKLSDEVRDEIAGQSVAISFGVASIVPNANGNAQSFLDMSHRALAAASQEGHGQIAFVNERGKLALYACDDIIDWDSGEEASA